MGFLDVFKTKKTLVEESNKAELNISELHDWFEKEFSGKIEKAESEIKKINKEILGSFPEIKKSIQRLEKPKVEEKRREDSIINSLKDSYVKRSLSVCNKFPADFSLPDFSQKAQHVLNELNNPNPKEIYVVSTYFKQESKALVDSIKQTQDLLNRLSYFLANDGKIIFVGQEIEKAANAYKEKVEENESLEIKILQKEKYVDEKTGKAVKLKEVLEHLKSSDKAKRETELGWEVEICEKELSNLEAFIKEQLSCLKRPMEKAQHEIELGSEEKKSIERFVKSPFRFFVETPDEVSSFLGTVKENMHSLKLKEADSGKIKKLEFQKLAELRSEYLERIKQKESAEKKLGESDLKAEIQEMEMEAEKIVKDIEGNLKEIQENKNRIASNKNEMGKIKAELKKTVSEKLNVEIEWKDGTAETFTNPT